MKVYVKLPDELAEQLDQYSKQYGLSKSGFIAYSLAKHIRELKYQEGAYQAVTDKVTSIVDGATEKGLSGNEFIFPPYQEK